MKVLKLSAQGLPQSWITLEQAALHYAADDVRWESGGEVACFRGGHNAVTGCQSVIHINSIIGTRGAPSINPHSLQPGLTNGKLFARDRCICAYCGRVFHENDLTREHIVPISAGGGHHWMNLVTACSLFPLNLLRVGFVKGICRGEECNGVELLTHTFYELGLRVRSALTFILSYEVRPSGEEAFAPVATDTQASCLPWREAAATKRRLAYKFVNHRWTLGAGSQREARLESIERMGLTEQRQGLQRKFVNWWNFCGFNFLQGFCFKYPSLLLWSGRGRLI